MTKKKLEHIKKTGFKVPKGYLNSLEDAVFAKVASENFSKKTGFENPEGYFDSVEENILKKIKLENTQKKSGYRIPENYLDTVEDKVLEAVNKTSKKSKIIDFKSVFIKRLVPIAVAASLLLFIFINYNQTTETNFDELASAEIEEWIDEDFIAFDTYEITEVFDDIELENEPFFEDEEIIDFLNGTDIESLIIEE